MKITFLTTIAAMFFTLPAFGFSLDDLMNLQKKPDQPRVSAASASDSASESSGAAVSDSALGRQTQTNPGGSETRNLDSPLMHEPPEEDARKTKKEKSSVRKKFLSNACFTQTIYGFALRMISFHTSIVKTGRSYVLPCRANPLHIVRLGQ